MKISKSIFAFFAAAAMVGCSSLDEVGSTTNPSASGESGDGMIEVTMQSSMEEVSSTKVNADLNFSGGLSYRWENGDNVDFVPFGGTVSQLTAVSVNDEFLLATFVGSVDSGKENRLIMAPKDAITYGADNATATLSVASQSSTLKDKFFYGFDENMPDNHFFINNDKEGVRSAINSVDEVPDVTFAHINTNVIFRVKFANGALNGVSDYKIIKLKLENVTTEADVNLKVSHKAANFMTHKTTGNIIVDVDSKVSVEEGGIPYEYWISVSVFPGITTANNATVTVYLEGTNDGTTQTGSATVAINDLMGDNTYDAGTNNAIAITIGSITIN